MKPASIRTIVVILAVMTLAISCIAQDETRKIRVGVYDNRVITVAYGNSKYLDMSALHAEHAAAKESGDTARVRELEELGPKMQKQLHYQGFCRVPVDDLLAKVKDKVAALAAEMDLDMIGMYCDYTSANVEVVDISLELAALFEPSDKGKEWLEDIKNHDPVALVDMEHDD